MFEKPEFGYGLFAVHMVWIHVLGTAANVWLKVLFSVSIMWLVRDEWGYLCHRHCDFGA